MGWLVPLTAHCELPHFTLHLLTQSLYCTVLLGPLLPIKLQNMVLELYFSFHKPRAGSSYYLISVRERGGGGEISSVAGESKMFQYREQIIELSKFLGYIATILSHL